MNAPLFATFLLGMFWKRTTGHGAFYRTAFGHRSRGATHGLTVAEGKGGWICRVHQFPSTMAQNFWIAICALTACFVITSGGEHGNRSASRAGISRPRVWLYRQGERRARTLAPAPSGIGRHGRGGAGVPECCVPLTGNTG